MNKVIGYARVSSQSQLDGYGLEAQRNEILNRYPDAIIYEEQYTAKTSDRPIFNKVFDLLESDDTLVVCKLDRFCRNVKEGLESIEKLRIKGVKIHILNMGLVEDTPMGQLLITNLLAFAEFERALIVERTSTGKAVAKAKAEAEGRVFREGRPKKYSENRLNDAVKLLDTGMSYNNVSQLTGISKSTLIRHKNKLKGESINE